MQPPWPTAFDPMAIGRAVWRYRRRMTLIIALAIAAGIGVSLLLPVRFEATTTLSPAAPESNALRLGSALAGLGGQLGLDIGGSRPQVRFYVRVLESYWYLEHLAQTVVSGDTTVYSLLAGAPMLSGDPDSPRHTDAVVARLRKLIDIQADERGNIFTVSIRMPTRRAALAACVRTVGLLTEFDTQVRRQQATENRRFVAGRVDSARARLAAEEDSLASFLSRNRSYQTSPELTLEYQRLGRRVSLVQDIYVTLARNLEEARIEEVREAPLLTVVDPPHAGWRKVAPKRSKVVFISFGLGLTVVLGLGWLSAGRAEVIGTKKA